MGNLCSTVARSTGGIKAMGGAAQGEFETCLGPMQLRLGPAGELLARAHLLEQRTHDFLIGAASQTALQEAWCLISKCLRETLSYDIQIIPSTVLEPLLEQHTALMRLFFRGWL